MHMNESRPRAVNAGPAETQPTQPGRPFVDSIISRRTNVLLSLAQVVSTSLTASGFAVLILRWTGAA